MLQPIDSLKVEGKTEGGNKTLITEKDSTNLRLPTWEVIELWREMYMDAKITNKNRAKGIRDLPSQKSGRQVEGWSWDWKWSLDWTPLTTNT